MGWNHLLESMAQSANDHLRLRNGYMTSEEAFTPVERPDPPLPRTILDDRF